jgi:hypothetical protein
MAKESRATMADLIDPPAFLRNPNEAPAGGCPVAAGPGR